MQNKTSEISKNAVSEFLGLLCAEQNVGNIKNALSCFVGLRLAEQNVGNLKNVNFVLALNKAHVLALNTAHVLRLNKADVLALNNPHVLRLKTKICPVVTANTKEAAFGRLHK